MGSVLGMNGSRPESPMTYEVDPTVGDVQQGVDLDDASALLDLMEQFPQG